MKLPPASTKQSISVKLSSLLVSRPKVIAPRHSSLTRIPLRPKNRYSISVFPPCLVVSVFCADHLVIVGHAQLLPRLEDEKVFVPFCVEQAAYQPLVARHALIDPAAPRGFRLGLR